MDGISFKDVKNIIRKCLIAIIPITIIFILLINYTESKEVERRKEYIINEQEERANMVNLLISNMFEDFYEDLILVKNSDEFNNYIADDRRIKEVEDMVIRFITSKQKIEEISFIDKNYNQIIKAYNDDGKVKLSEKDKLQNVLNNKSYEKIATLEKNQVYISNMNLKNSEKGNIEIPHKAVMKLSVPVFDQSDQYKGIVEIEYSGTEILDSFKEYTNQIKYIFLDYSLLNSDGYYLYDGNTKKVFGHIFNNRKKYNMAIEHPEFWKNINSDKNIIYEDENKIYHSMKLDNFLDNNKNYENYWMIYSSFNINEISILKDNIIFGLNINQLIIL
ncbi:cache domain-containing protein, partial [Senegalia sp. (in: firmicutes)]